MKIGLVKWFDNDKGFGVIVNPENEFFLHINNSSKILLPISVGTSIIFESKLNKKKAREEAINCHLVCHPEDWKTIMEYLGVDDEVWIDYKYINVTNAAAKQLFINKSQTEIFKIITNYFDTELDKKYFLEYCEFIEGRVSKDFDPEKSGTLLKEIFNYFGNNLTEEIFFYTWKNKNFRFIGYIDSNDYEITIKTLNNFKNEIGLAELKRIQKYPTCSGFLIDYLMYKFSKINEISESEINSLFDVLELLSKEDKKRYKVQLDKLLSDHLLKKIRHISDEHGIIKSIVDIGNMLKLRDLIPPQLGSEEAINLEKEINNIIKAKCPEEFKAEIWYRGILENISNDKTESLFFANETNDDKRINILMKLLLNQQLNILIAFSKYNGWSKSFEILEKLFKKENSLTDGFKLSEKLFDDEFLKGKKHQDLVCSFRDYLNENVSDEEKAPLFFKGLIKEIPKSLVLQNIGALEKYECDKIFSNHIEDKNFIKDILLIKISKDSILSIEWIYGLASKFLDSNSYNEVDQKVLNTIDANEYFKFWTRGKAKLFPIKQINSFLNDKYEDYYNIDVWIANQITTKSEIALVLLNYLKEQIPVKDRITFLKQFNHIKFLLHLDENYESEIHQIKNDLYEVAMWYLGKDNAFNFELLKSKFIYFPPEDQIKVVRKLFYLKTINVFDLTIEKLSELTRIDLDLYRISKKIHPEIDLDLSTSVIIEALLSFKKKQKFLVKGELLEVVIKNLGEYKSRRFKIEEYFEECPGRQIAKISVVKNGEIEKIMFGSDQFYFAISFSTANPLFKSIKDDVKNLPERTWNMEKKYWEVPSQYENEVLDFARKHHFYIHFESEKYKNNITTEIYRDKIPNGIKFCEGHFSNTPHRYLKKNFWWCAGEPCFKNCETIHKAEEWEKFTLLDFCEILKLNTNEKTDKGDVIPRGKYYHFINLINRFNPLLQHLYCEECKEILYPIKTADFAAYNVTRFNCANPKCPKYREEIYLNHCWNCFHIIDSRKSKKCPNGFYICSNKKDRYYCRCCCSNKMFINRLNKLKEAGQVIPQLLIQSIEMKIGHLEKRQKFCHKCGKDLKGKYYCDNCDDSTDNDIDNNHLGIYLDL